VSVLGKKLSVILACSAATLALLAALFHSWNSPGLDSEIREIASERHIEITGEQFGYSLVRGLIARNSTTKIRLPKALVIIRLQEGRMSLKLSKLLHDTLWCTDIAIQRATIDTFLLSRAQPLSAAPSPDSSLLYWRYNVPRFEPKVLLVSQSSFRLRDSAGAIVFSLEGLSFRLHHPRVSAFIHNPLRALVAQGEMKANAMQLAGSRYSDVSGSFGLSDGQLALQHITFKSASSTFKLSAGNIDFTQVPPALRGNLSAVLDDARPLFGELSSVFTQVLPGELHCDLSGTLTNPYADGYLSLDPIGDLRREPLIAQFLTLLDTPPRGPLKQRRTWFIPFTNLGTTLVVSNSHLDAGLFDLGLSGSIQPGKSLDLRATLVLPRSEAAAGISARVLDQVSISSKEIRIPLNIEGVPEAPTISLRRSDLPRDVVSQLESFIRARSAVNRAWHSLGQ